MNVMKPNHALLVKLGQIIIDYAEYVETDKHSCLKSADRLLEQPDVQEWFKEMRSRGEVLQYNNDGI